MKYFGSRSGWKGKAREQN